MLRIRNRWLLIVEDNGRGLVSVPASAEPTRRMGRKNAFGGARVDVPGVRARHRAPSVIMDCVRTLDGELDLRVAAGGGLGLEIRFAGPARAQLAQVKSRNTVRAAAGESPAWRDDAAYASALAVRPATR